MATIPDTDAVSDAVQDYAKAIYSLQERSDEPVSTSALA
jgi:Mn-dependent DtxR family transcriptional regulator